MILGNIVQKITRNFDNKKVIIYKNQKAEVPVIYTNMYTESGNEVLTSCDNIECAPFHLVTVSNLDWFCDMSPWAHIPVLSNGQSFGGHADEYMNFMINELIPYCRTLLSDATKDIICGYSMGGLFALYASYITDAFSNVICVSGSVWYPDFLSFAISHEFKRKPDSVYFSLGNRECRTKNSFLCQTENYMIQLKILYTKQSICSAFELNPGNHFKEPSLRLAKGIKWTLDQCMYYL